MQLLYNYNMNFKTICTYARSMYDMYMLWLAQLQRAKKGSTRVEVAYTSDILRFCESIWPSVYLLVLLSVGIISNAANTEGYIQFACKTDRQTQRTAHN